MLIKKINIITTFQDALIHKIGIWVTTSMIAAGMPSIGARMVHRPMNGCLGKERNILRITVAHAEREHKVCSKLLYWRGSVGFRGCGIRPSLSTGSGIGNKISICDILIMSYNRTKIFCGKQ